ncbi:hypothetical protein COLO4_28745 [Corchorus olitorius]|uniref:Uncharacterized protein n=1 Tax=Corchorus olitorius TaxID=93759 RepID=A0A1R3HIK7_9ROSI|nr:hypothetical protein COLO4_28745 [Corchorus olitorius]
MARPLLAVDYIWLNQPLKRGQVKPPVMEMEGYRLEKEK